MPRFGEDESLGIDALQPGTVSSHDPNPCRGQLITLRGTVAGRLEYIRGSLVMNFHRPVPVLQKYQNW